MLGCIIGPEGIHANPDKTKAILSMVESSTKKRSAEANRQNSNFE